MGQISGTCNCLIEKKYIDLIKNSNSCFLHYRTYKEDISIKHRSLFEYYKDVDFTFQTQNPHQYPLYFLGDIMYQKYRGSLWNEYQLVFIKGNRVSL